MTIYMQAPAPNQLFGVMPSGSTYQSDATGLVRITSNSVADQIALTALGCVKLTPNLDNYAKATPATGFNLVVPDNTGTYILAPAATLATGTLTMPANPTDGQSLILASTKTVTALTMNPNAGQTISAALTTIAANGFARWKFLSDLNWYRTG